MGHGNTNCKLYNPTTAWKMRNSVRRCFFSGCGWVCMTCDFYVCTWSCVHIYLWQVHQGTVKTVLLAPTDSGSPLRSPTPPVKHSRPLTSTKTRPGQKWDDTHCNVPICLTHWVILDLCHRCVKHQNIFTNGIRLSRLKHKSTYLQRWFDLW